MRVASVIVLVLLAAVAAAMLPRVVRSPRLRDQWRLWQTDRAAIAFVDALAGRDSTRIARLSKSGTGHNILCAVRLWPSQHWVPASYHSLYRLGPEDGEERYRLVGFPLPGDTGHAVMDFWISDDAGAPRVARFGGIHGGKVMAAAFQACIHQ